MQRNWVEGRITVGQGRYVDFQMTSHIRNAIYYEDACRIIANHIYPQWAPHNELVVHEYLLALLQ